MSRSDDLRSQASMDWTVDDVPDQSGKIVLITGANTGIGYATAKLLATRNAFVILGCRNLEKGQSALARIVTDVPQAKVDLLRIDLASLNSIRKAASDLASRYQRLDMLVNNAGIMMPPYGLTVDGFEQQFGTNVLGHFLLTGLVLPMLDRAEAARVIWLSSLAHWNGRIDFDNLNAEKSYSRTGAYAQSKLADLILAYEMQRRLQRAGSSIVSLGAHPGVARSELARSSSWFLRLVIAAGTVILQPAEAGALPSIRAAVDPEAHGGDYYGPSRWATFSGPPVRQRSSARSHDRSVAAQLWQTCERMTNLRWLDESLSLHGGVALHDDDSKDRNIRKASA